MHRHLRSIALIAAVALLLAACADPAADTPTPDPEGTPTPDAEETPAAELPSVTWSAATTYGSPDHWAAQLWFELVERVAERTDGRFQINVALLGELGIDSADYLPALNAGRIQMAELFTGHQSGHIPLLGLYGLPFLISGPEDAAAVDAAVHDVIAPEFEEFGVSIHAPFTFPGVHLWSSTEVADPTDWAGLRVRAYGDISASMVEALRGTAIVMAGDEAYTAVQRGVLDGGLTSTGSAIALSWYEIAPEGYYLNTEFPFEWMGVSMSAFEELPQEYQAILLEEFERIQQRGVEEFENADVGANEEWLELGGRIHEPTEEEMAAIRESVRHIWEEWAERSGPSGEEALAAALSALGID